MNNLPKFTFNPQILSSIGPLALFLIVKNSYFYVQPGSNTIIFNKISGTSNKVYREGYHLKLPFLEETIEYNVRMADEEFYTECASKDLQTIYLTLKLIHRPAAGHLQDIYRELGHNYKDKVFNSIVEEIAASTIAQFNASQLISQRDTISSAIAQKMIAKGHQFFIDFDDVSIKNIEFSKKFREAIELKKIAEQRASEMKYKVDIALKDKERTIIKASGFARACEEFGKINSKNKSYLKLMEMETALKISEIIKKSNARLVLDPQSFNINLPTFNETDTKV